MGSNMENNYFDNNHFDNNYFNTIVQEPVSPEREIREGSAAPPKLRRGDYTRSLTGNKDNLLKKYLDSKIETANLKSEIIDLCHTLSRCKTSLENAVQTMAISEKKLQNVQEILFENSEKIPEGLYVRLMESLVKT